MEITERENPIYMTVRQFVESRKGLWPASDSAVRAIIMSSTNGTNNFQKAFKWMGRRVLVDVNEFWACVDRVNEEKNKAKRK